MVRSLQTVLLDQSSQVFLRYVQTNFVGIYDYLLTGGGVKQY